jgi:hypothetical protein
MLLRLLVVVLVIGGAFVASLFFGTVLEKRAISEREAIVRDQPAGLATAPPSLTPETKP